MESEIKSWVAQPSYCYEQTEYPSIFWGLAVYEARLCSCGIARKIPIWGFNAVGGVVHKCLFGGRCDRMMRRFVEIGTKILCFAPISTIVIRRGVLFGTFEPKPSVGELWASGRVFRCGWRFDNRYMSRGTIHNPCWLGCWVRASTSGLFFCFWGRPLRGRGL